MTGGATGTQGGRTHLEPGCGDRRGRWRDERDHAGEPVYLRRPEPKQQPQPGPQPSVAARSPCARVRKLVGRLLGPRLV
jgi:hypothetical protein